MPVKIQNLPQNTGGLATPKPPKFLTCFIYIIKILDLLLS